MRQWIANELGIHRRDWRVATDATASTGAAARDPGRVAAAARRRYRLHTATLASIRLVRRVKHWRTDAYVLSYPKCGRTWLRVMLGRLFQSQFDLHDVPLLETKTFAARRPGIPRLQFTHDDDPCIRPIARLQRRKRRYRHRSVLLLVREPKDVAVSLYFQMLKRDRVIDGGLEEFLFSKRGGLPSIIAFYNIWARNFEVPKKFALLRYEDMRADPVKEFGRVVKFLGLVSVDEAAIAEAARFSSFERMQAMERDGAVSSFRLTPGDPSDPESYKVRRGEVGGHAAYMNAEQIARADALIAERLDPVYGYTPLASPCTAC